MLGPYVSGYEICDYHTQNAGTVIDEPIQAQNGKRLALVSLAYLSGATAHNLRFLYAKDAAGAANLGSSRNTVLTAAAVGAATITTVVAPKDTLGNAAAANDICAYQISDDTWEFNIITGIVGSVVSLTAVTVGAVKAGAKFLIFGIAADNTLLRLVSTASVETFWPKGGESIVLAHPFIGEPFYLSIDNAANAGFLGNAIFAHIDR
jgi:hypothetical protein